MRDYKGLKFHRLTLICALRPGGGTRGRLWLAKCNCGNSLEVSARDVAAGRKKSCGKCPKELGKSQGGYRARSVEEARFRKLIYRTAKEAERKSMKFALMPKDLNEIELDTCVICREPTQINTLSIEPVDPIEGYTVGNTRAVCRPCKRHMAGSNLMEFLDYIKKIWIVSINK